MNSVPSENPLRVLVIGIGGIWQDHQQAIDATDGLVIHGVCDLNTERCKTLAQKLDCLAFADYRDVLESGPDLVVICLPHHLHAPVGIEALTAGCHVLVEKPMANSVEECRAMLRAAAKADRRLAVAEVAYHTPGAQVTGQRFAAGDLGKFLTGSILNARQYFRAERPDWFLHPATSGGGMFANIGLHRLAITRASLPGMTPTDVTAHVGHVDEYAIEACTSALVRYCEGGAMLYEELGYFPCPSWLN